MKRFKHRLEYGLVRLLDLAVHLPSRQTALRIGELIGVFFSWVVLNRRRLVLDNLAHAFPEKSLAERRQIAATFWRSLGRAAVEFVRLEEINQNTIDRYISFEGLEILKEAIAQQKGVIMLAAHYTSWEVNGVGIQLTVGIMRAIARPMKNPFVESWVRRKRGSAAMDVILHREAVKASLKWLKQKKMIGILVDQNLYTGGTFVNFFGRPAATTTLPALLHLRTGAPMICTYTLRERDGFKIFFEAVEVSGLTGDNEKDVQQVTQQISDQFERIIRRSPSFWFWIHNRWKRKPS